MAKKNLEVLHEQLVAHRAGCPICRRSHLEPVPTKALCRVGRRLLKEFNDAGDRAEADEQDAQTAEYVSQLDAAGARD